MATKNKAVKDMDLFSRVGKIRPMRLNGHTINVVTPRKLLPFKVGQKKLRDMLRA